MQQHSLFSRPFIAFLVGLFIAMSVLLVLKLRQKLADSDRAIAFLESQLVEFRSRNTLATATAITSPATPSVPRVPLPPPPLVPGKSDVKQAAVEAKPTESFSSRSKIHALSQFVKLSPEQEARLRVKFSAEEGRGPGQDKIESLEEIIGAEAADAYRQGVRETMKRVEQEEFEKDLFFVARKLELSNVQETSFAQAKRKVEQEVKREFEGEAQARGPQEMLRRIDERRRRENELLNEALKEFLSEAQVKKYQELRSLSAAEEIGVWHAAED